MNKIHKTNHNTKKYNNNGTDNIHFQLYRDNFQLILNVQSTVEK